MSDAADTLLAQHARLVEQTIGLLAWSGYWPTHLNYDTTMKRVRVMNGADALALVSIHWPGLGTGDYVVRLSLEFYAPPLCVRREEG